MKYLVWLSTSSACVMLVRPCSNIGWKNSNQNGPLLRANVAITTVNLVHAFYTLLLVLVHEVDALERFMLEDDQTGRQRRQQGRDCLPRVLKRDITGEHSKLRATTVCDETVTFYWLVLASLGPKDPKSLHRPCVPMVCKLPWEPVRISDLRALSRS